MLRKSGSRDLCYRQIVDKATTRCHTESRWFNDIAAGKFCGRCLPLVLIICRSDYYILCLGGVLIRVCGNALREIFIVRFYLDWLLGY